MRLDRAALKASIAAMDIHDLVSGSISAKRNERESRDLENRPDRDAADVTNLYWLEWVSRGLSESNWKDLVLKPITDEELERRNQR